MALRTIEAIPLLRFPWNAPRAFTYGVPNDQEVPHAGTWVRIPFRGKSRSAVVVSLATTAPKHKKILFLSGQESLIPLPETYLDFILNAASRTHNHPARFLAQAKVKSSAPLDSPQQRNPRKKTKHATLIWPETNGEYNTAILARAKKYAHGQHLILSPTVAHAHNLFCALEKEGVKSLIFYRPRASAKEHASLISALINGTPYTVIGARASLFLPFSRLTAITVTEEEHHAYKQESPPPRYHARSIVPLLASAHGADLAFISSCPSLVSYHSFHPTSAKKTPPPSRVVISDRTTFDNFTTPISPQIEEKIITHVDTPRTILILTDARGYAPLLQCKDCRFLFRCAQCNNVLGSAARSEKNLICNRCGYTELIPPLCPSCNGSHLSYIGFGPARMIEYLDSVSINAQRLSSTASIDLIPHPAVSAAGYHQDGDTEGAEPLGSPTEACPVARYKLNAQSVSVATLGQEVPDLPWRLIIIANIDAMLAQPHFTASENALQLLVRLSRLVSEDGKLIVQTAVPEHPVLRALQGSLAEFYEEELRLRKTLHYPPFTMLVRITLPAQTEKEQKNAENMSVQLKKTLNTQIWEIIHSPSRFRRKKTSMSFTLRYPAPIIPLRALKTLTKTLKKILPANAVIDTAPETI